MRAKIREILEECIELGIEHGIKVAHKYVDEPPHDFMAGSIDNSIWFEIDQRFDFERNVCDEVVEGFDHLEESYDQTALELCERCGWKALIPEDGCLNCNRSEWVGLTDEQIKETIRETIESVTVSQLVYSVAFARAIEAKLKEKNT